MSSSLTFDLQKGIVTGTLAGRHIHIPTDRQRTDAWEPRSILDTVSVGGVTHRLEIVENAALEIYDFPGSGRTLGPAIPSPVPIPYLNVSHVGPVVFVREGGFCIHGMPPCNSRRCVVITQSWDSVLQALTQERRLTFTIKYRT